MLKDKVTNEKIYQRSREDKNLWKRIINRRNDGSVEMSRKPTVIVSSKQRGTLSSETTSIWQKGHSIDPSGALRQTSPQNAYLKMENTLFVIIYLSFGEFSRSWNLIGFYTPSKIIL